MAIPEKLNYLKETKRLIRDKIETTGQSTAGVSFRDYIDLIDNIPNTGAITESQIGYLTNLAIQISGEKA